MTGSVGGPSRCSGIMSDVSTVLDKVVCLSDLKALTFSEGGLRAFSPGKNSG